MKQSDPITSFDGAYSFLSNFYKVPIAYEGLSFPSVEHAYQAAKSTDPVIRNVFTSQAPTVLTSAQAKKAGRKVILRDSWTELRVGIMHELLRRKFLSFNAMEELLLSTGDKELVEGNWWGDTFWGVCSGVGENNLGKLLMQVREELNGIRANRS